MDETNIHPHGDHTFSRLIALAYYDGPVAGYTVCDACDKVFSFDMMDWDVDHVVRLFALWPVLNATWQAVLHDLGGARPQQWPVWVPAVTDVDISSLVSKRYWNMPIHTGPADLILVWHNVEDREKDVRLVSSEIRRSVSDWTGLLQREDRPENPDWFHIIGIGLGCPHIAPRSHMCVASALFRIERASI